MQFDDKNPNQGRNSYEFKENIELSLIDIFEWFKKDKRIILGIAAAFLIFSLITIRSRKPVYKSSMIVAPVTDELGVGDKGSSSNLLQGLGISTKIGKNGKFSKFLDLFTSPLAAERIEEKYGMMKRVLKDQWNEKENKWVAPANLAFKLKYLIKKPLGLQTWQEPTYEGFAETLEGMIDIEESEKSEIVRISVITQDPKLSHDLLLFLHREADNALKEMARTRNQEEITNTKRKLDEVQQIDHRQALIFLLMQLEQTRILSAGELPYAASLIQTPSLPINPVPVPLTIIACLAILGGLIVGSIFSLFKGALLTSAARRNFTYYKNQKEPLRANPVSK